MSRRTGLPRRRPSPVVSGRSGTSAVPDRARFERGRRRALLGLVVLFALEFANGIFLIARDAADPEVAMEVSPWLSFGVRTALSAAIYPFAYRGYRSAWILTWARLLLTGVLVLLAFDLLSLSFLVPIAATAAFLVFDRETADFRRVGRWKDLPSEPGGPSDDSWSVLGTPPAKGR